MADIQRYALWQRNEDGETYGVINPDPYGTYVTYVDHVAAVAEAEQRVTVVKWDDPEKFKAAYEEGYEQGYADGFKEGMTWRIGGPSAVEYWQRDTLAKAVAAVEGLRVMFDAHNVGLLDDIIAAIKGVNDAG